MHWLLMADFLSTWGYSQVLTLLNLYLLQQGFDLGTIGAANSVSFLAGSLLAVPAGLISDIFGHRTGLILSSLTLSMAIWIKLQASNTVMLYAAFGLIGTATALATAAKTPAVATIVPASQLPSALALCRALTSIAAIGGGVTSAWLVTLPGGRQSALWVGAFIASLAFLPLLALPGNSDSVRFLLFSPRGFGSRPTGTRLLPFLLFCIGSSCVFPFINVALANRGMSEASIGLSFAAFQTATVLAWPITRWLGRATPFGLQLSLCGLMLSCIWLMCVGPTVAWWVGWLGWHMWLGAGYSFFLARFGAMGGNQGSFFGFLGLLQMAAAAAGSWLGGLVAEFSLDATQAISGALLLLALLMLQGKAGLPRVG